jgi:hypothetical protein
MKSSRINNVRLGRKDRKGIDNKKEQNEYL